MKFLNENQKLKITGYSRKTDSGYDSWDDANANGQILYALQSSLETKRKIKKIILLLSMHVHDRYYDTAVKNKYYSKSYTLKGREN